MGNKNLISGIKSNLDSDGGSSDLLTSTCKIWAAPRLMPNGAPALGFYPSRRHGPVIQAVEVVMYAEFYEQFLSPGGQYFSDPGVVNDALAKRDRVLADIEQYGETESLRLELQNAHDEIRYIKEDNKERIEAEKQFSLDNVAEFIVMNHDGVTKIDYNERPEDWEVVILGRFSTAQYCMVKPASGAPSAGAAMTPDGQSEDQVNTTQTSDGLIQSKIARIRNISTQSTSCKSNMVRSDGQNVPVDIRYPKDGDTWIGGVSQNLQSGRTKFFRSLNRGSVYLQVDETGKVTITGGQLEIKTDPRAIAIGDFVENPLQTIGASNSVTPIERFRPRLSDLNFTAGAYNMIKSLINDLERIKNPDRSEELLYDHEIIDFNDFVPPSLEIT